MGKINIKIWIVIVCMPLIINAQDFKSAFGFTSKVPDNWLIITRETVSKNPDIFNFENEEIKKMDSSLISQIKKMTLSGKIELMYYKNSDVDFFDNIRECNKFCVNT